MAGPLILSPRRLTWRSLARLTVSAVLVLGALVPAPLAAAQVRDVPRKDTLILSGFGPGLTEIQDPTNMNPYSLGGLGRVRDVLNKTIFEFLYLYNHNTGEEIPWLAESYTVAADAQSVDVTLRQGVEWSDGQPFTADDIKFTLELLRDTPSLVFAADIKEWVRDVTVTDPTHFRINLNKPNVRFFYFYFIENSEIHLPMLPRHVWQGQDPATFSNYDLAAGWPVGTGPSTQAAARDLHPAGRRGYGSGAHDQQRLRRRRRHAAGRVRSGACTQSQHRQLEHLRTIVGCARCVSVYAWPEQPLGSDRRRARAARDFARDQSPGDGRPGL